MSTPPSPAEAAERIRQLEAEVLRLREEVRRLRAQPEAPGPAPHGATAPGLAPAAVPGAVQPKVLPPSGVHAERVLLVEDHPTDLKITQMMLESLGYAADTVRTGDEAIKRLEQQRYDIVLMDVQLPGMDGLETTRKIRARWPDEGPHIIALTGRSLRGDREACLSAGMDDYISKPIALKVLESKLNGDTRNLVDNKVLRELSRMAGSAGIVQLVDIYLRDLPRILGDARQAVDSGNAEELHQAVHPLKSASASLGVRAYALLAKKLDTMARMGNLQGAAELVARLEGLQTSVEQELRTLSTEYGGKRQAPASDGSFIPDSTRGR